MKYCPATAYIKNAATDTLAHVQTISTKNEAIMNHHFLYYGKSKHYSRLLIVYTVQSWHNCHMIWINACFRHHVCDGPVMAKFLYL
jgi:hypothetical protein